MAEQIYQLIPEAMRKIGAIGKDSVNTQQKYKFRGIDAVYNALNPVMSELGLFICPEILDHRREERETANHALLKYSILTVKFTMYAPDGSNVYCTVVGEGMDSGDKASNKAMSVALKYACFQLFMIPTEEMVDPDQESYDVTSRAKAPDIPKETRQERLRTPETPPASVNVTKSSTVPQTVAETPVNPVLAYLAEQRDGLRVARGISKAENNAIWSKQIAVLTEKGIIENKALSSFTMEEAVQLVNYMYSLFTQKGTELISNDGETA